MKFPALFAFALLCVASAARAEEAKAVFAGGCFWCMESEFSHAPGVSSVISGFTGGHKAKPTYEEVSTSGTGHAEAVEVHYDPARIAYAKLLDIYWSNIDPTDAGGQFADRGSQYRPVIYTGNEAERQAAEQSKRAVETKLKQPIAVAIEPVKTFYPADEHHQDYSQKHPVSYNLYKVGSGRPARLKEIWGGR